jgi:hypothetical protein
MLSIGEVAQRLETLLEPVAARLAQETGWVRRRSKLTGPRFVQTLVLGWLRAPQASLEALCQTAASLGVAISPQGLDQRFTPAAADCLKAVLDAAVASILATEPVAIPVLARFPAVTIEDSSTVTLPPALAELWAGCGTAQGTSGDAALKLQVRLDLCTGQLSGPRLVAGRAADQRTGIPLALLPAGALRIADLGYFSLETFGELDARRGYYLSRLQSQTAVYDADGRRVELGAWLRAQERWPLDQPVRLGSEQHVPARLLAVPVPQDVADARRRRLREALRGQGRTVSAERLALAGWTLLVTNAPVELMTVRDALVLYRVRWQIELLFKLWKQHGRIDEWRSAKPWRVLCELYAKLVAMLIQHWCLLVGCWAVPNRSWVKAAETIRAHAPVLASALAGLLPLTAALEQLARTLAAGCRLNRRCTHPNTVQYLFDPGLAEPWLQAA